MSDLNVKSCRACHRAFTRDGYGAQSEQDPKRCRDCWHIAYAFPVPSPERVAFLARLRGGVAA